MRHFINDELLALNVMTVPVDQAIVAEFEPLTREAFDNARFERVKPPWNSDVQWISGRTEKAFDLFQSAFDRMNIAQWVEPYVDFDNHIRLFGGFLVLRSTCAAPSFHVDWLDGQNNGFTMLTPITDNCDGFGLIYKKLNGETGDYRYRLGEALVVGSNFVHSTAPGRSDRPVALLSFTFGSDKEKHWDSLAATASNQSSLYRRFDGNFCRNDRAA